MNWVYRVLLLLLLLPLQFGLAGAATCQKTGSVCVDGPSTKDIGGVPVTMACWDWKDTYSCVEPNLIDNCTPLVSLGCGQTNSICSQNAFNGECVLYTNSFTCTDKQLTPPFAPIVQLPTTYRILRDEIDLSGCSSKAANPNCTLLTHVCTQGPGTRNINGLDVTRDCWEYTDTYNCPTGNTTDDCGQYSSNTNCSLLTTTCLGTMPDGVTCDASEKRYRCMTQAGTQGTIADCSGQQMCLNGTCFNVGSPPDRDFAKTVTGMELVRQAGMYMDPATNQFFKGTSSECTKNAVNSCCKASSGSSDSSNAAYISIAAKFAMVYVQSAAKEAVKYIGSTYVYDLLSASGTNSLAAVYSSAAKWADKATTLDVYGFQFTYSAAEGFTFVGFDPWSLLIAVIIYIVVSYLFNCEDEEIVTAMRKEQRLCYNVGSYCKTKLLGFCIKTAESYCCYNSRLARIVSIAGHKQLGKSWGTPQAPKCDGFTETELGQLDFSQIDMSEFYTEIKEKANANSAAAQTRWADKVQQFYGPAGTSNAQTLMDNARTTTQPVYVPQDRVNQNYYE